MPQIPTAIICNSSKVLPPKNKGASYAASSQDVTAQQSRGTGWALFSLACEQLLHTAHDRLYDEGNCRSLRILPRSPHHTHRTL